MKMCSLSPLVTETMQHTHFLTFAPFDIQLREVCQDKIKKSCILIPISKKKLKIIIVLIQQQQKKKDKKKTLKKIKQK